MGNKEISDLGFHITGKTRMGRMREQAYSCQNDNYASEPDFHCLQKLDDFKRIGTKNRF
jgi:hypothetical protein